MVGALAAYRLESPDATAYTPIVPNHGLYESRVLGLEVQVEEDHLRFSLGTALLFESEERTPGCARSSSD